MKPNKLQNLTNRIVNLENRFKNALDAAEVGIWEWDLKTNDLFWDERMFALFGIEAQDFNGEYEDFRSRVHPEDIITLEKQIQDALLLGVPYIFKFRAKNAKTGEWRLLKGQGGIVKDEKDEPISMIGINLPAD